MRTTVDLPDDVHTIVVGIAKDRNASLSSTIADIVTQRVRPGRTQPPTVDPETGFLTMTIGEGVITSDDVKSLEDEV